MQLRDRGEGLGQASQLEIEESSTGEWGMGEDCDRIERQAAGVVVPVPRQRKLVGGGSAGKMLPVGYGYGYGERCCGAVMECVGETCGAKLTHTPCCFR